MTDAIIVVDAQNDFCEGGSLAVTGGLSTTKHIRTFLDLVAEEDPDDVVIVATKDWHIDPEGHFAEEPDYVDTWPIHCVVDTDGADFAPALRDFPFEKVFYKGKYTAAYSGFEGVTEEDVTLDAYLKIRGVNTVNIVGLAFDYCVAATARDAAQFGYTTFVLSDLTASVSPDNFISVAEALTADDVAVL